MNMTLALGFLACVWVFLCVVGGIVDYVAEEIAYLRLRIAHRSRMKQRARQYRATH